MSPHTRVRLARVGRRIAVGCLSVVVFALMATTGATGATGAAVNGVEGQSFTGTVVSGLTCPLASASISWGDATAASAGASDGNNGIQGTHTYVQEGRYSGSVSFTYTHPATFSCPTGTQTAAFQATVQDAPLTSTGVDITGTAGQPLDTIIAHVRDANPAATPAELSAQIAWGDGSSGPGTVTAAAGGGFDVSAGHTYSAAGTYPVSASVADDGGSSTTANATATIGSNPTPPPPPPPPPPPTTPTTAPAPPTPLPAAAGPVNLTQPFVSFDPATDSFVCDPGTWQNLPTDHAFSYEWLRRPASGAVSVVARTLTYKPTAAVAHDMFGCQVTVPAFTGSTIATPGFTQLTPITVPISAYGDFRVRGIDVLQVVQPNACAALFAFPTGAFPCFSGAGTPTPYGLSRTLTPGADPQRTTYAGVQVDADKQTTAIVYVDRTEGVSAPGQTLEVTLKALWHGRQIGGTLTRLLTKPLRYSETPWVAPSERPDPAYGVQFAMPARWLQVAARQRGGAIDLVATIGFPAGTPHLLAVECNPRTLTVKNLHLLVPGACSSNNTFRLDRVPALHLLPLVVRSFELLGNGQNPSGSIAAPGTVLSRARQLFPGGERVSVLPYANWIGVRDQESLNATATPALSTEIAPVFTCNTVRYPSSATNVQTQAGVTRACRFAAITAVVRQWETENPDNGFDVTMAVHNFAIPLTSGGTGTEPGWTPLGATLATVTSKSDAVQPLLLVNDGSAKRPLGAATHEFGHVMGLPHASAACGGGTGGQIGETWPPDQTGLLQGLAFDPSGGSPATLTADSPTTPLFDLMSYCGPEASLWLSPRNWNHAFATLRSYAALPATPATGRSSRARAATAKPPQAFVVGVTGAGGSARIVRVVQPHGHDTTPATLPGSPLQLRALDSSGRVLVVEGVQVQPLVDAPDAATFVAPVPIDAATIELISDGVVVDRKQRNRPPHVRLLAPGRRAIARSHGSLPVRWSAGDPDGDPLQATVDYSADGGHRWRTVFDGTSTGRATVPGRFLEGSRHARIRVYVNDGFSEAHADSPLFRAQGTPPTVQISRPGSNEAVRSGESTLLLASASDDRHRSLHGRALTWFVGPLRLGSGEQLQAQLPAGRVVLRLVARDQGGRRTTLRRVLQVDAAPLRLTRLDSPDVVRHGARTVTVRIAASAAATLQSGGRRYHVGLRPTTIILNLPARPATGLLTLPLKLVARRFAGSSNGPRALVVVRL